MDDAVTATNAALVTVKVVALSVCGFMRKPDGTLKVALMGAVGHTPVAAAAGIVEVTVTFPGAAAAPVVKVHT